MVKFHVFYSGRVQGVGFRYTVYRLAKPLNIGGWVKNLADSRVEMIAVGRKEVIQTLCDQIDEEFSGFIKNKQCSISKIKEAHEKELFHDFTIEH